MRNAYFGQALDTHGPMRLQGDTEGVELFSDSAGSCTLQVLGDPGTEFDMVQSNIEGR